MGMLRTCAAPDCSCLTLGEYCLEHESQQETAEEPQAAEPSEPVATTA